jgi:hypothetical protein
MLVETIVGGDQWGLACRAAGWAGSPAASWLADRGEAERAFALAERLTRISTQLVRRKVQASS